jgi:hypothetical protein
VGARKALAHTKHQFTQFFVGQGLRKFGCQRLQKAAPLARALELKQVLSGFA